MKEISHQYTYRVTWSEDDQEYVALCAEFPSLSWLDESAEKALRGIQRLVKSCIQDLQADKAKVPQPISLKRYSGKFVVRVLPETHRKLALQATEQGVSLNRLVASKLS